MTETKTVKVGDRVFIVRNRWTGDDTEQHGSVIAVLGVSAVVCFDAGGKIETHRISDLSY
jgi:hypothetical protein